MCLPIFNWRKSLLACRTVLAVALLCSVVGILFSNPHTWSRSNNNVMINNHNNEMTDQESNIALLHISQELVISLLKNNQTMDTYNYCRMTETCKSIKCTLAQFDSGEVARKYIESEYKKSCKLSGAVNLLFERSTFPNNKLKKDWLKTEVAINELTFTDCSLTTLDEEAFASQIFYKTTKLHLWNNNISILRRATFRHLPNLQELSIRGNEVTEAERDLLNDVSSLESLSLEDVIRNNAVLRNITGGDVLPKLKILSLRSNYIPIVNSSLFFGVPNVNSLYLSDSQIKTVCANTFEPISKSVIQIIMNNNNVASLPEGLFDPIIQQRLFEFGLAIHNNPWHCNCDLKWLQDMIIEYPNIIKEIATCKSPKENTDKSFLLANFCNDTTPTDTTSNTDLTTTDTTISTDLMTDATITTSLTTCDEVAPTTARSTSTTNFDTTQIIHIKCNANNQLFHLNYSHQLFLTNELEIPLRFMDFSATELDNRSIKVTLPNTKDVSLIWFNNDARSNLDNLRRSIQCVNRVRNSYLLENVQPQTSYTICSLDNVNFSPLNCLGLTTRVLSSSASWLSKLDKNVIIAVFVSSLILMCLVSAVLMFITVRRHPAMLRGSKRVVIVKRRTLDAMILPKGFSSESVESANRNTVLPTISRNLKEIEYVTPLPPSARNSLRRNSRASVKSDGPSYISGVEPTLSQLNSWRLKRSLSIIYGTEPPPLPPHPLRDEQPLSIVADLNK